jgi:hypothetical protein
MSTVREWCHRDSEELLRILKCLVPEPRLEVAFGLRQVEQVACALMSLQGPLDGCVQSAEESGNAGATTKIGLRDWRDRMLHSAWRKSKPASDRPTEGGACGKDRQRRR